MLGGTGESPSLFLCGEGSWPRSGRPGISAHMLCPVADAQEAVRGGFPFSSGVKWPRTYPGAAYWQTAWGHHWGHHCPRSAGAPAGRVWQNRQAVSVCGGAHQGSRLGVIWGSRADLNLTAALTGVRCIMRKSFEQFLHHLHQCLLNVLDDSICAHTMLCYSPPRGWLQLHTVSICLAAKRFRSGCIANHTVCRRHTQKQGNE